MRHQYKIFILCLSIVFLLVGCGKQKEEPEVIKEEPVSETSEFKCIVLEGSPYDVGLGHGKALKDKIREIVAIWKADIAKASGMEADSFIEKFLSDTDFVSAIKKWTPGLLEETRGIAEGSGIDFNTMLAFQLMDEVWLYMGEIESNNCSAIGMGKTDSNPSYVAQNMDLENFRNGFQVLLHIKYEGSDLECFVFTCAGLIIANGMNNKSIGVCVNAMSQMNYAREGLPIAFVVRGILEQTTLEDAVDFVHKIEHASGQNYVIGGPENAYSFEASAAKIIEYTPDSRAVYHTNHPLVNDDYNEKHKKFLEETKGTEDSYPNSVVRLQSLDKRLKDLAEIDVDIIKSALSARDSAKDPVCRPYDTSVPFFTFGCTVMVLSENPELHVAPGPPDVTPFQIFRF